MRRVRKIVDAARVCALRLGYGLNYGALVRERVRFAVREAMNGWAIGTYHIRDGGFTVLLRHHPSPHGTPSNDTWVLREIFRDEAYKVPALVDLPADPKIVDLGANLGLFIAFILSRFPRASVVAFEPDGENAGLLRESAVRNGYGDQVIIYEACAMPFEGPVMFAGGGHQFSRLGNDEQSVQVAGIDVFPFLDDVDLLKMDIEGAEWQLLADPRFGAPRNVVMEYHPMMCPSADPPALVRQLLKARGYRVILDEEPMVWAVKMS